MESHSTEEYPEAKGWNPGKVASTVGSGPVSTPRTHSASQPPSEPCRIPIISAAAYRSQHVAQNFANGMLSSPVKRHHPPRRQTKSHSSQHTAKVTDTNIGSSRCQQPGPRSYDDKPHRSLDGPPSCHHSPHHSSKHTTSPAGPCIECHSNATQRHQPPATTKPDPVPSHDEQSRYLFPEYSDWEPPSRRYGACWTEFVEDHQLWRPAVSEDEGPQATDESFFARALRSGRLTEEDEYFREQFKGLQ